MNNTMVYSYLIGWVVTSAGLALAGRHQSRQTFVTVLAGAAWPLLLLGTVQFVVVALFAEAVRVREPGPKSIEEELEDLLTESASSEPDAHDRRLPIATGNDSAHESGADDYWQTVVG
jgi:hypothetical protein